VEEGKMNCFIAFVDGKHVAVSLILNHNGITALDYSFVLPEYKQKGIEEALNQYSIKSAFEIGAEFIIGYAHPAWHPESYVMFKKLGFSLITSE
jgi:predicted N-acetyltransferase YhbS